MARPNKIGLDYFPLDVILDDSVELVEAECGLQGFAILIKLWQKIYSNGYYIEWSEDNALLFSRRINVSINEVNSVINACFKRNLFSRSLYDEYNILTNVGIQKRYFKIINDLKRKKNSAISEYLLIKSELIDINTELTHINDGDKYIKEIKGNDIILEDKKKRTCDESQSDSHESSTAVAEYNLEPEIKYSNSSFEMQCVDYLILKIKNQNPNARIPLTEQKLQSWSMHINRLRRIDNKPDEEILKVLEFATENTFWKSNILSTQKFREKYDTLYAQMVNVKLDKKDILDKIHEW